MASATLASCPISNLTLGSQPPKPIVTGKNQCGRESKTLPEYLPTYFPSSPSRNQIWMAKILGLRQSSAEFENRIQKILGETKMKEVLLTIFPALSKWNAFSSGRERSRRVRGASLEGAQPLSQFDWYLWSVGQGPLALSFVNLGWGRRVLTVISSWTGLWIINVQGGMTAFENL